MVVNQMHNPMKAPVYCPAVVLRVTKILPAGAFLILCHMQCMVDQLVNSFIFRRRNRNDGDSKQLLQLIDPHGTAVLPHLIHHVEREHHRNIQL